MSKLKVIVIGPEEAGKTLISNIISDMSESNYSQYEQTEGVRILEIETTLKSDSSGNVNVEVELWDCGGSQRFQTCWPIVQLDAQGVIFVCNPQNPQQLSELELLYNYFIVQGGLHDNSCMIFINERNNKGADSSSILSQRFRGMMCKTINAANNPNGVKSHFSGFIEGLWNALKMRNGSTT